MKIELEEWKYIKAWAEYGASCDSINNVLVDQIDRDTKRTEKMQTELNKEFAKNSRLKIWLKVLGGISGGLAVLLVILIAV